MYKIHFKNGLKKESSPIEQTEFQPNLDIARTIVDLSRQRASSPSDSVSLDATNANRPIFFAFKPPIPNIKHTVTTSPCQDIINQPLYSAVPLSNYEPSSNTVTPRRTEARASTGYFLDANRQLLQVSRAIRPSRWSGESTENSFEEGDDFDYIKNHPCASSSDGRKATGQVSGLGSPVTSDEQAAMKKSMSCCSSANSSSTPFEFCARGISHSSTSSMDSSKPDPINIPEDYHGKVTEVNPNDVLCGKGRAISDYSGNIQLRARVLEMKKEYQLSSKEIEKAYICALIVADIRSLNPPGRFLELNKSEASWKEIGDERARKTVELALLENERCTPENDVKKEKTCCHERNSVVTSYQDKAEYLLTAKAELQATSHASQSNLLENLTPAVPYLAHGAQLSFPRITSRSISIPRFTCVMRPNLFDFQPYVGSHPQQRSPYDACGYPSFHSLIRPSSTYEQSSFTSSRICNSLFLDSHLQKLYSVSHAAHGSSIGDNCEKAIGEGSITDFALNPINVSFSEEKCRKAARQNPKLFLPNESMPEQNSMKRSSSFFSSSDSTDSCENDADRSYFPNKDLSKPPPIDIPEGYNGKVTKLNSNDVVCGRGRTIGDYLGNIQLRTNVQKNRKLYRRSSIKKIEKAYLCAELVAETRSLNPPGRFLERDETEMCWKEIGDKRARRKVGQIFRESRKPKRKRRKYDDVNCPQDICSSTDSKSSSLNVAL